ncbi:LOW QUALITY PROTEIN: hypothetical protein RJ639_032570, partial [Escallonia herrerae]
SEPSQLYRSLHFSGRRHLALDATTTTVDRKVHRSTHVLLNNNDFSGVQMDKETEERRKRNSRRIITTVEDRMMKTLRAKEEKTEKIGK